MSRRISSAMFDLRGVSAVERVILLKLADQADDHGYVWLGVDTLAASAEIDSRSVRRILRRLEERRLLDVRYPGGGRSRPSLYRLLPTTIIDSVDAKGRRAYEGRFGVTVKPGPSVLVDKSETRTLRAVNPDRGVRKPGPGGPPTLYEPIGNDEGPPARNPGESASEWLRRIHGDVAGGLSDAS